jgi:phosphoglycolate phosphatase
MCVEMLRRVGLTRLFSDVAGGDRLPVRKPDPAPLRAVLEGLGVPAARATMVGDGAQDLQAGRAAGCRTIGVLYGFRSREVLDRHEPDHVVETFPEVLPILGAG